MNKLTFDGIRLNQSLKAHFGVNFHAQQKHDLQQDALQLSNTNMIYSTRAELPKKLLSTKSPQILDHERPQVEDIVP